MRTVQRALARRKSIANEQDIKNFSQNFDTSAQQTRPRRHSSIELHDTPEAEATAAPVDHKKNRHNSLGNNTLHRSESIVRNHHTTARRGHRNSTGSDDIHNRPSSTQVYHEHDEPHNGQRSSHRHGRRLSFDETINARDEQHVSFDEPINPHHARHISFSEPTNPHYGRHTRLSDSTHPHHDRPPHFDQPTHHHGRHDSLKFDSMRRHPFAQREHSQNHEPHAPETNNPHHKHERPTHGRHGSHGGDTSHHEAPQNPNPEHGNDYTKHTNDNPTIPNQPSAETPSVDEINLSIDEEFEEESEYSSTSNPREEYHQHNRHPRTLRPPRDEYSNIGNEDGNYQRPPHHNQRPPRAEYNNEYDDNQHNNQNYEHPYNPHNQRPSTHPDGKSNTVDWDQVYQFRDYPLIAFVVIAYGHYPKTTVTCIILAGLLAGAFAIRKHEAIAEWWNSAKEKANDFIDFSRKKINHEIALVRLNMSSYKPIQALQSYYLINILPKKIERQAMRNSTL